MKKPAIEYGAAPIDLGPFPFNSDEMMLYLYLPISLAGSNDVVFPKRLTPALDIIEAVLKDIGWSGRKENYIYLTAKTMFVDRMAPGNRPGWHADGYGSGGDLNYVWHSMNPTEFAVQDFNDIPDHDFKSMQAMAAQIDKDKITTYPNGHLLRLDESVVHRVAPDAEQGMRSFIKISVSQHRYNLKGNSRNYELDYDWPMHDRALVRNLDNKDFVK